MQLINAKFILGCPSHVDMRLRAVYIAMNYILYLSEDQAALRTSRRRYFLLKSLRSRLSIDTQSELIVKSEFEGRADIPDLLQKT